MDIYGQHLIYRVLLMPEPHPEDSHRYFHCVWCCISGAISGEASCSQFYAPGL